MIYLLLWCVIWRGMMRTPLTAENAWVSALGITALTTGISLYIWKIYWLKALRGVALVALFGIVIEFIGIRTCFPYGCFEYSALVWPRFLGTFPYTLFFLWPVIVMALVQAIPYRWKLLVSSFIGWIVLMLFDLSLDPIAVYQGLWQYDVQQWYWVPRSNFLWWILSGTISSYLLLRFSPVLLWDRLLEKLCFILVWMYGMAVLVMLGKSFKITMIFLV